jgi:hypothetical protein
VGGGGGGGDAGVVTEVTAAHHYKYSMEVSPFPFLLNYVVAMLKLHFTCIIIILQHMHILYLLISAYSIA